MKALSTAASAITAISNLDRLVPARWVRTWPAQAVTPDASNPSLTTNRVAMKMTTGSPKPLNAVATSSTPVKYSASAVAMATMPTGSRFQTNSATDAASTNRDTVALLTGTLLRRRGGLSHHGPIIAHQTRAASAATSSGRTERLVAVSRYADLGPPRPRRSAHDDQHGALCRLNVRLALPENNLCVESLLATGSVMVVQDRHSMPGLNAAPPGNCAGRSASPLLGRVGQNRRARSSTTLTRGGVNNLCEGVGLGAPSARLSIHGLPGDRHANVPRSGRAERRAPPPAACSGRQRSVLRPVASNGRFRHTGPIRVPGYTQVN